MKFHSFTFAAFLVCLLAIYWLVAGRRRLRYGLLLLGSCVFYGAFQSWYLLLILFSTVLDYNCGQVIAGARAPAARKRALIVCSAGSLSLFGFCFHSGWRLETFAIALAGLLILGTCALDHRRGEREEGPPSERVKLTALCLSLTGNLGLLGFFKYFDWGIASLSALLQSLGVEADLEVLGLVVPVGISFYTFQTLSYTIDIYRGQLKPARNILEFGLFVAFFPQLVAGPIVRAREFLPQLELTPRFDRQRLHDGLYRIAIGLAKKTLVADTLGRYLVDPVYTAPGEYGPLVHLLVVYAFTFQVYFDFSAYSDIAIGTARLFGFDLPENFFLPFRSRGLREFWRRWHVTLSSWVRDYLYFPLGGSRASELRVAFNLIVTMLVIGLWHGASSLWVVYGLSNGVIIVFERLAEKRRGGPNLAPSRLYKTLGWLFTLHCVCLFSTLIRAESWGQLGSVLTVFGDGGLDAISHWGWWALAAAFGTHFMPYRVHVAARETLQSLPTAALGLLLGALIGLLWFVTSETPPFIYFQF